MVREPSVEPTILGRYVLYDQIGAGGMATIHLARHAGPLGFARTVAIKRLHPNFARDPEFLAMLLDEARLAACISHPNVAAMLDVVTAPDALCLVMEYLEGENLATLMAHHKALQGAPLPPALAVALITDALRGLHAAHEAVDGRGRPLSLVHRDVSPHNLFVGIDGMVRVLDFGIAKATARAQVTRDGQVKGKLAYMSPEQIRSQPLDRRSDIFAAGIVLWELLTAERLFSSPDIGATVHAILNEKRQPPSQFAPEIPTELDALLLRALAIDPAERFPTAAAMLAALDEVIRPEKREAIGDWVKTHAARRLAELRLRRTAIESVTHAQLEGEIRRAEVASGLHTALRAVVASEDRAEAPTAPELAVAAALGSTPAQEHRIPHPRESRRRAGLILASAVFAVAALGVTMWFGLAGSRRPPAAPDPQTELVSDLPQTTASPPVNSEVPPTEPPPVSSGATTAPSPATVIPHGGAPPPSKGPCDPPYRYDNGIKRYKPQCL